MTSALTILERTFRPLDLPRHARNGCATCGTAMIGVYLLVDGDDISYVGSSTDILRRLYDHGLYRQTRPFDRALYLSLPRLVIPHYEGALIRALRPRTNGRTAPRDRGHDAEILFGLGLRDALPADELAVEEVAA